MKVWWDLVCLFSFGGVAIPKNFKRNFKHAICLAHGICWLMVQLRFISRGNACHFSWEHQPWNFTLAHLLAPVSVSVLFVLFLHLLPVPGESKHEEQNSTCARECGSRCRIPQSTHHNGEILGSNGIYEYLVISFLFVVYSSINFISIFNRSKISKEKTLTPL